MVYRMYGKKGRIEYLNQGRTVSISKYPELLVLFTFFVSSSLLSFSFSISGFISSLSELGVGTGERTCGILGVRSGELVLLKRARERIVEGDLRVDS